MPGLPANHVYWISRIDASHFDAGTAYVAVDGHRDDDLKPYLFVTRDYGQSWASVAGNLPAFGNIQVVREDPKNRNLLYVGTEFGLYVSLDGGKKWKRFMNNLPTARVDDILVHPRDNDLIVATHARSIWIADDITPLQQLAATPPQDRGALRHAPGGVVSQRSAERPAGRRAEGVRWREPGARRGDELLPAVSGDRRRQDRHRGRHRTRGAHTRRHQERRDQPRHVEPHGGRTRPGRPRAASAAHQSSPERTWPR